MGDGKIIQAWNWLNYKIEWSPILTHVVPHVPLAASTDDWSRAALQRLGHPTSVHDDQCLIGRRVQPVSESTVNSIILDDLIVIMSAESWKWKFNFANTNIIII